MQCVVISALFTRFSFSNPDIGKIPLGHGLGASGPSQPDYVRGPRRP